MSWPLPFPFWYEPCTTVAWLPLRPPPPAALPDYKHIMREDAMVTAGEMRQRYQDAESYEDDFM